MLPTSRLFLTLLLPALATSCLAAPQPYTSGSAQTQYFTHDFYCHHIIAVDEDGNALLPLVARAQGGGNTFNYTATNVPLADEDTRYARVNSAALADDAASGNTSPPPYNPRMAAALMGRKPLYDYLDAMFQSIHNAHPREVVVYVHGGLNDINGAIEKSAMLADICAIQRPGVFFIGLCWNSDLMPTYDQHLFSIREGLHQPLKAILTSPAMLLSDWGGAAMRMPLNIVDFWFQDAYTLHPEIYKRTRLANARYNQITDAPNNPQEPQLGRLTATDPGDHADQTTRFQRDLIFGSWLLTEPVKISSTFFLDGLAAQPWKNMLRRTRTMFERESEFLPELTYSDVKNLAIYQSNLLHKPIDPVALLDQINSTGRTGAVEEFCDYSQQRLAAVGPHYPTITLVGHSMGAIVGSEVVSRFHQLPLDNLVFEGAACSIRDFKKEVVPYLEEQNLRESIWNTFKTQYGIKAENSSPVRKTHFYDLCLHDNAENGEENPGDYDLSERGSLLTWIDILYQNPESENDRCLGRWVNAILSTDDIPKDILNRITIKEFGRNRITADDPAPPQYGFNRLNGKTILEPMKHGNFTSFNEGPGNIPTNLEFWATRYRQPEKTASRKTQLTHRTGQPSLPPSQPEHKTIGAD